MGTKGGCLLQPVGLKRNTLEWKRLKKKNRQIFQGGLSSIRLKSVINVCDNYCVRGLSLPWIRTREGGKNRTISIHEPQPLFSSKHILVTPSWRYIDYLKTFERTFVKTFRYRMKTRVFIILTYFLILVAFYHHLSTKYTCWDYNNVKIQFRCIKGAVSGTERKHTLKVATICYITDNDVFLV